MTENLNVKHSKLGVECFLETRTGTVVKCESHRQKEKGEHWWLVRIHLANHAFAFALWKPKNNWTKIECSTKIRNIFCRNIWKRTEWKKSKQHIQSTLLEEISGEWDISLTVPLLLQNVYLAFPKPEDPITFLQLFKYANYEHWALQFKLVELIMSFDT